jgi:hypothetical protein
MFKNLERCKFEHSFEAPVDALLLEEIPKSFMKNNGPLLSSQKPAITPLT